MTGIFDLISSVWRFFYELFLKIANLVIERFLEFSFFDKLIIINTIGAFFAVVLSVGRHYLFDQWIYINNPLSVNLLGIVFVMILTAFFPGTITFAIRLFLCSIYLILLIYQHSVGFIKPPYELVLGYYVNILVIVLYLGFTLGGYFIKER